MHIFSSPNTILKFFIFYLKNYGIISVGVKEYLPAMKTDITLEDKSQKKVLIIDTKYYTHTMTSSQYEKKTLHSNNLYQIFTYVKNKDVANTGNVSGMLLYAKTNEDIVPDEKFVMGGNKMQVKTLDLNQNFENISRQLDGVIFDYWGIRKND